MSDDISDSELAARMKRWATFEDDQDRLVPFRDACTTIADVLGELAPSDVALADLSGIVRDLKRERDQLRTVVEDDIGLTAWAITAAPLMHAGLVPSGATQHETAAAVRDLIAERDRLRGVLLAADVLMGACENCHDDWLRAQDVNRVNVRIEFGQGTDG